MFKIIFPLDVGQHYYSVYYQYVLHMFYYLKCDVSFANREDFIVSINGVDFLFDLYDTHDIQDNPFDLPIFKFHTTTRTFLKVFAFPPISFYNWREYYGIESNTHYDPRNITVSFRQRAWGNAKQRRTDVNKMLNSNIPDILLRTGLIERGEFWEEINELGINVCVPGWQANMLDRGQFQYMAFGACTISPYLPEILPFNTSLDGCYIRCKDDYSDLIDKIINTSVEEKREIAYNAKRIFKKTSTPVAVASWIKQCL